MPAWQISALLLFIGVVLAVEHASDLERETASEVAAMRGYVITSDAAFLRRFQQVHDEAEEAIAQLHRTTPLMIDAYNEYPRTDSSMASSGNDKHRIFVVDDHTLVRKVLVEYIAMEPDFAICGQAASGEEALWKLLGVGCDLAVADVAMPRN